MGSRQGRTTLNHVDTRNGCCGRKSAEASGAARMNSLIPTLTTPVATVYGER